MGSKQETIDLCAGCFEREPRDSNKTSNRCEKLFVPENDEQFARRFVCKLHLGGA